MKIATCSFLACITASSAMSESVEAFTSKMVSGVDGVTTTYIDIDADGSPEGLIVFPDGDWSLVSSIEALNGDAYKVFDGSASSASNVYIDEMEGGRGVVVSDNIFWRLDAGIVAPYYSLLEREGVTTVPASFEDRDVAAEITGLPYADDMNLKVYLHDITGGGIREKVIVIEGSIYALSGNLNPYAILNTSGEIVVSGYSMDMPRIFPNLDGSGATIYDVTLGGLLEKHIGP